MSMPSPAGWQPGEFPSLPKTQPIKAVVEDALARACVFILLERPNLPQRCSPQGRGGGWEFPVPKVNNLFMCSPKLPKHPGEFLVHVAG